MRNVFSLAVLALGLSLALPAVAQPQEHADRGKATPGKKPKAAQEGKAKDKKQQKNHAEREAKREKKGEPREKKAQAKEARREAKEERKDERSAEHKKRDELRAARLEARADRLRKEGKEKAAGALEKRAEKIKAGDEIQNRPAAWKKHRDAKKLNRLRQLRAKYGRSLEEKPVQNELRRHGRVGARLNRLLALAEEKDDEAVIERIEKLRAKEHALHGKRMAKLASKRPKGEAKPKKLKQNKSNKPKKENK